MAQPDISGALAAGYSPTEVLNALQGKQGAPDIAGARAAGYSDAELLAKLTGSTAPTAAPPVPAKDGSLGNAVLQSVVHGMPAAVASGLSGYGRFMNNLVGSQDTGHVSDQLDAFAGRQEQDVRDNYQAPADAPQSAADAIAGSSGPLGAAARLAQFGVRKTAENAGAIIPNLALGLAAPESIAVRAGLGGYDFLQNLAGVRGAKAAAGADPNNVSLGDIGNAAGQTALMAATPLGAGGGLFKRAAGGIADSAMKGGVQSVANDTGALLQGGNLGNDPASIMATIGSHALDAGVAGATAGSGIIAGREGAANVGNYLTARKAGPNMQAFSQETAPWNAAVDSATQRIQAADPSLSPEEVQQKAYVLAQQGTPGNPGVAPPSFDALSPAAQNGMAELATVQMYQKARQSMTDGMGRPDADPAPAQVFKNILATVTDNLKDTASLAKQAGLLDRDQAGDFMAAIEEARKHNVLSAENGADFGWFDTLRDKVAQLPLDPVLRNQALQMLRVADISSQASLYKNSKGPLERNAGMILPALGAGAGMLTSGAAAGAMGGMAGQLFRAQGTMALRGLDSIMGHGLPDILQRQGAIEKFAQDNGLSAVADPMALQQMNNELRGLGPKPPMGPQAPQMPPQGPQGPVTASGQGYGPATPMTPPAPPQAPQSAPSATGLPEAFNIGPNGATAGLRGQLWAKVQAGDTSELGRPSPVLMAAAQAMKNGTLKTPADFDKFLSSFYTKPGQAAPAQSPQAAPMAPGSVAPVTAADRLAAAPTASPAVPQAVSPLAAGRPDVVQAMSSINDALQARATRLSQAAQAAFPSDRRGWSAAMADQLGVQHGPMMAAIQSTVAGSPELQQAISGATVPLDMLRAMTNHMGDLRDAGKLPRVDQAQAPAPSGTVRNPLSYAANLAQEKSTAEGIKGARPDLANAVDAMRDPVANGKTAAGRHAVLTGYLASLPKEKRAGVEAILRPLAGYGQK